MAAKKKTTKPYGNKTKFVMGLPRDLSAKQVVEKAKQQGITITEAHVYKIRSTAKSKPAGKAPGKPGRPPKSGAPADAAGSLQARVRTQVRAGDSGIRDPEEGQGSRTRPFQGLPVHHPQLEWRLQKRGAAGGGRAGGARCARLDFFSGEPVHRRRHRHGPGEGQRTA